MYGATSDTYLDLFPDMPSYYSLVEIFSLVLVLIKIRPKCKVAC